MSVWKILSNGASEVIAKDKIVEFALSAFWIPIYHVVCASLILLHSHSTPQGLGITALKLPAGLCWGIGYFPATRSPVVPVPGVRRDHHRFTASGRHPSRHLRPVPFKTILSDHPSCHLSRGATCPSRKLRSKSNPSTRNHIPRSPKPPFRFAQPPRPPPPFTASGSATPTHRHAIAKFLKSPLCRPAHRRLTGKRVLFTSRTSTCRFPIHAVQLLPPEAAPDPLPNFRSICTATAYCFTSAPPGMPPRLDSLLLPVASRPGPVPHRSTFICRSRFRIRGCSLPIEVEVSIFYGRFKHFALMLWTRFAALPTNQTTMRLVVCCQPLLADMQLRVMLPRETTHKRILWKSVLRLSMAVSPLVAAKFITMALSRFDTRLLVRGAAVANARTADRAGVETRRGNAGLVEAALACSTRSDWIAQ